MNEEKERLVNLLRKLEGVYKITSDAAQKERVAKEIKNLKDRIENITETPENEDDSNSSENISNEYDIPDDDMSEFKILSQIEVKKVHPLSNDEEVNEAASYLNFFEAELWGILSEFHLRLDYFYSKEREKLYNGIEPSLRILKEYKEILDEIKRSINNEYKEKMNLMRNKLSRAFLIESMSFMKKVNVFLSNLIKDYKNGGNIILEPEYSISFPSIEGEKMLNGKNIIEAIEYVYDFTNEFLQRINIPEDILNIRK